MPLRRKLDRVLTTMLGVKFLMRDSQTAVEVACRAERELLRERFGSHDRISDAEVFALHRREIERVASQKYDAGNVEPHTDATVVVRTEDFASPLSRKFNVNGA